MTTAELMREIDELCNALARAIASSEARAVTNRADPFEPYRNAAPSRLHYRGTVGIDLGNGGRWVQRAHGCE